MADKIKVSPNGTPYRITNLWDEIAFQLIYAKESILGGVKSFVGDTVNTVIDPVAGGFFKLGKSFTSFIPILLVIAAIAAAVYFFIIKKKVNA